MKYCPKCGTAGVEGMKFCPECGERLTDLELEVRQQHLRQPEVPSKKMNWFEGHIGWTLSLVIICSPFILYGIFVGLAMLATLLPPSIGEPIVIGTISAMPIVYIVTVIYAVNWYKGKKKQRRTIADCDKAITSNPSNAEVYYRRGFVYSETDECDKAMADYNKAIELDPNHALAYYKRGCSYARMSKDEKAIADYSRAIELSPNLADAYLSRGLAYSAAEITPSDACKCLRSRALSPGD